MTVKVGIVPHTHWDREWYAPFQEYRLRLVRLLDGLLPELEADTSFAHFCLDGQTAVIDDYLEIRPEAEERLRSLAAAGRISLGPWAILMDEFMVSAETIVRNLQMGRARATQLGAAMPVGYLPDMFGHVAQMPQILRLAGLEHAVVWRGVPGSITATGFWWEAPDGSRVRAEYLYGSYSNGRDLPPDGASLVERARNYEAELGAARLGGMLLMNGTDHQLPQPWVGQAATEANGTQNDYAFEVTSLADYLAGEPAEGLPVWRGELRSGARSNLLMGVTSNRVDVKREMAAAERALERRAEPLLAAFRPASEWPAAAGLLGVAWRNLVLNSAHDSSCACSHDEVVDQVMVRYREARQVGDALTAEAMAAMAAEVDAPAGALLVVNPAPTHRLGDLVETVVPGEGPLHFRSPLPTFPHTQSPPAQLPPTQLLRVESRERFSATVAGAKVLWVLDMMRGREFGGRLIRSYSFEPAADPLPYGKSAGGDVLTLQVAWPGGAGIDLGECRRRLAALGEAGAPVTVRSLEGPLRHVLISPGRLEGFSWTTLEPVEGAHVGALEAPVAGVIADGRASLANRQLAVEVDPTDGTFSITTADGLSVAGLNRYVDGGDGGDTYNWSPPGSDLLVGKPSAVTVDLVESGPLRARAVVTATYEWPTHAEGDERSCSARSQDMAQALVRTTITVSAGSPVVGIEADVDNQCRDHRLRAHFPLPARVEGSDAECAFAVVRRGLEAEGGPGEVGLPTFPARRFVDCADGSVGLALLGDSLLEYEVTEDGAELALTMLRAVGYLSRLEPTLRPNAAGPPVPVVGAQMLGRQVRRYGVVLHRGDWAEAKLHRLAEGFTSPLETAMVASTSGTRAAAGRAIAIDGDAEVSAVLREGDDLVVRVYNPKARPALVSVRRDHVKLSGSVVDLTGAVVSDFRGDMELRPGEIVTLRLPAE